MPQNQELTELIADVKEQVLYLQELGVETFDIELAAPPVERLARAVPNQAATQAPSVISQAPTSAVPAETPPRRPAGSRLAALPSLANRKTPVVNASGAHKVPSNNSEIVNVKITLDPAANDPV